MIKLFNINNKYLMYNSAGKYLAYKSEEPEYTVLEPDYTPLEWIGNDSNCFISVPLVTAGKDIVEIEYEAQFTRTDVVQAEIKNGDPYFFIGLQANSVWYAGCGDYGNSSVKADTEWHHFRLVSYGNDNGFWLDGTRIYQSTPRDSAYLTQGFRLWIGQGGSRTTYNRKKYVKVRVNGKLVYDLIPVLDKNFVACMYDKVSGKYFYNQGDGEFKCKLPNQLEYLQCDGNQWIDTGFAPSSNTRVVGSVLFNNWLSSANYAFGAYGDDANFGFNVSGARIYFNVPWSNNTGIRVSITPSLNTIYSYDISKDGLYVNEQLFTDQLLASTFQATKTMFIGWCNGTTTNKMSGRIYPHKIYENDKLVHYLIPYLDDNNIPCMYDLITKQYFVNQGTGQFIGG